MSVIINLSRFLIIFSLCIILFHLYIYIVNIIYTQMFSTDNSQTLHKYIDSEYTTKTTNSRKPLTNLNIVPQKQTNNAYPNINTYTYKQKQSRQSNNKNNNIISNNNIVIDLTSNVKQKLSTIYKQLCKSYTNIEERELKLYQIAQILADKIQRLRHDRQVIKNKYVNDVHQLSNRITELQDQNSQFRIQRENGVSISHRIHANQNYTTNKNQYDADEQDHEDKNQEIQSMQYFLGISKQSNKNRQSQQIQLSDQRNKSQAQEQDQQEKAREELQRQKIQRMALKYNICGEQLQYLLNEYLKAEADNFSCPPSEIKKLQLLKQRLTHDRKKNMLEKEVLLALKQGKKKIQQKSKQFYRPSKNKMNKQNYY